MISAGVALCAGLDLAIGMSWHVPPRIAGRGVDRPPYAATLGERRLERVTAPKSSAQPTRIPSPRRMRRTGTVTRLAPDADLRVLGVERIRRGVVSFANGG